MALRNFHRALEFAPANVDALTADFSHVHRQDVAVVAPQWALVIMVAPHQTVSAFQTAVVASAG